MKTNLFHKDVFLPWLCSRFQFGKLSWTNHAKRELFNDKYGDIPFSVIPTSIDGRLWELIEVEQQQLTGSFTKIVIRQPIDATRSLVLVIIPDGIFGIVKTCWVNMNTDKHKTLDRSKYATS